MESDGTNELVFGFLVHNYKLFRKEARWGALYKLVPGVNYLASIFLQGVLIQSFGSKRFLLAKDNGQYTTGTEANVWIDGCARRHISRI